MNLMELLGKMIELFNVFEIDGIYDGMTIRKRINENMIRTEKKGKIRHLKIAGGVEYVFCDVIRNKPTIIVCLSPSCNHRRRTILYIFDKTWNKSESEMMHMYHNSTNVYLWHQLIEFALVDLSGLIVYELTIDEHIHIDENDITIYGNKCGIDGYLIKLITTTKKHVNICFLELLDGEATFYKWIIIDRQTHVRTIKDSAPPLINLSSGRLLCQGRKYSLEIRCYDNDIIWKRANFYLLTGQGTTRAFGLFTIQNLQYLSNENKKRVIFYLWLLKTPSNCNIVLKHYLPKFLFITHIIPNLIHVINPDI